MLLSTSFSTLFHFRQNLSSLLGESFCCLLCEQETLFHSCYSYVLFSLTSINPWAEGAQHPAGDARYSDKTGFLILHKVMVFYSFKRGHFSQQHKSIVLNSWPRTEKETRHGTCHSLQQLQPHSRGRCKFKNHKIMSQVVCTRYCRNGEE